jgi:excisionase family DNA binding protein
MKLMTQREVAAYLRCSPRQVRRLPLRHTFVGRLPRYAQEDLDAYLESRTVDPQAVVGKRRRRVPMSGADKAWLDDMMKRRRAEVNGAVDDGWERLKKVFEQKARDRKRRRGA